MNSNGLANGNGNGNLNGAAGGANYQGYLASLGSSVGAGNANGNGNTGTLNGVGNGNYNEGGQNIGNGNGNNNYGIVNGIGNGNFNGAGVSNVGNNNGNGNLGVANGVGNGNFLVSGSNSGNNNGNGNIGSGNGNGNGNGPLGTAGVGSGNNDGTPVFPAGFQSSQNGNLNGNGNGQGAASKAAQNTASGKGDPYFTGFDQRVFEFIGQPGTMYSLISERHHQVSTRLKLGVMWDHNGTYMDGIGFQYRDHQVTVELSEDGQLAVRVNGERMVMTKGETELELIPFVEGGELLLLWQLHREGLGQAVELTTDLLQVVIWVTPAGTMDDGGLVQPAYLNFDAALLGPPASHEMQGIVGETYNRMLAGAAMDDPDSKYYLPDDYVFHGMGAVEDYVVDSYFAESKFSVFGKDRKRLLIEGDDSPGFGLAYPLSASIRHPAVSSAASLLSSARHRSRRMGRF
ncbi:g3017 [Coccomyxa viridis]|uniref:G3017 protein n=1 Tax=Coccomyxa viridis TaxID=1274662 RepID=A0ABP1FQT3_9CHLO